MKSARSAPQVNFKIRLKAWPTTLNIPGNQSPDAAIRQDAEVAPAAIEIPSDLLGGTDRLPMCSGRFKAHMPCFRISDDGRVKPEIRASESALHQSLV